MPPHAPRARPPSAPATRCGRFGTAEEVAETVLFLLSDGAGFITGRRPSMEAACLTRRSAEARATARAPALNRPGTPSPASPAASPSSPARRAASAPRPRRGSRPTAPACCWRTGCRRSRRRRPPSAAPRWRSTSTERGAGERLAQAALEAFGRIDILVNNAGIGGSKPLAESDDDLIDRFIDTNLKAVLRVTRAMLPHLPRPGGRIVSLSSTFGIAGVPGTTAYAVAKAGVAQMTRQLAAELGPAGILVNAVAPGVIETAMTEGHLARDYYRRAVLAPTPLRRAAGRRKWRR